MTGNNLVRWNGVGEKAQHCFGRQALPMLWDFAEPNFLGTATGCLDSALFYSYDPLTSLPKSGLGHAGQADAQTQSASINKIISTDPPYYNNIFYADLSDFFYAWLRKTVRPVFPSLFATIAVPKAEELVATTHRHGSKEKAQTFFLNGMTQAMHVLPSNPTPKARSPSITHSNSPKHQPIPEQARPAGRHFLMPSTKQVCNFPAHGR